MLPPECVSTPRRPLCQFTPLTPLLAVPFGWTLGRWPPRFCQKPSRHSDVGVLPERHLRPFPVLCEVQPVVSCPEKGSNQRGQLPEVLVNPA